MFQGGAQERTWMDKKKSKNSNDKGNIKQLKGKKKKVAKALDNLQGDLDPSEARDLKNTGDFIARSAKRSRKLKRIRTVNDNDFSQKKKKRA